MLMAFFPPKQNFVLFMLSNLLALIFMASGFYVLCISPSILLLQESLFSHLPEKAAH